MKKLLLLTMVFVMFYNVGYSQECGTEVTQEQINYLNKSKLERASYKAPSALAPTRVPIQVHVARTTNGTGGLSSSEVTTVINVMNDFYINSNIEFFQCNAINYINNDLFYDFESANESLISINDVNNVINIYFTNTLKSGRSGVCGYTRLPPGADRIFMNNGCALNGATMSHEMGHYLSLYHTHGKSNGGTTDELVNGSNCDIAGDDVCDTPADPNLTGLVNSDCNYTGNNTDANGDRYVPDPNNVMSYSRKACKTGFSSGQYNRIAYSLTNDRDYLTCFAEQFTPDPAKIYHIDSQRHNLRLAASGESEDAYTASTSATGSDVEWKFIDNGEGFWHIQRAAGGNKPRLRSDNSANADMQGSNTNGTYTYFDISAIEGTTPGYFFITLPRGPSNHKRLQIDNRKNVKFVSVASAGTWESFKITEVSTTFPDPTKTYYIDSPHHNLRLAASGESEDAYTASTSATGSDVEWKFVEKGNGFWHIQRAAGGNKPRLRTDSSANADMQETTSSGSFTYYELTTGSISGTYFITLPDGPNNYKRLQVDNRKNVKFVSTASAGTWESFLITDVSNTSVLDEEDNLELDKEDTILMYPNPVSDTMNIKLLTEGEDVVLSIVGLLGNTISENKFKTKTGVNVLKVNTDDLSSGTYLVFIMKGETKTIKRIIIQ